MFSVGRDGVVKELEAIQAQLQTARPVVPDLPQFPPNWRDIRNPLPEMKSVSPEDAKRYLESNPQSHIKINFKDFTHINCDDSLQGTGLEGGSPERNAALLGSYLERADLWDTKVDPVNLDRAKKLLLSLEDKRNGEATNQRQISDLAQEYGQKIDHLQVGESLAIPGGFMLDSMGHAMVYLITRDQDGDYSFRTINTGDGIRFHASIEVGEKTKYSPALCFLSLKREFITRVFLENLIQVNSKFKSDAFGFDTLYQLISMHLRGAPVQKDFELADFITAQRSGTCAIKANLALIRMIIGESSYKKLIYFMSIDSANACLTDDFNDSLIGSSQHSHKCRTLALAAARNLMHKATKLAEKARGDLSVHQHGILVASALMYKVKGAEDAARIDLGRDVVLEDPLNTTTEAKRSQYLPGIEVERRALAKDFPVIPEFMKIRSGDELSDAVFEGITRDLQKFGTETGGKRALIEMFVRSLSCEDCWQVDGKRAFELIPRFIELMNNYVDLMPRNGVRVGRHRNTIQALYVVVHILCKKCDPDLAAQFGVNGLIPERHAGQLFSDEVEFQRHKEIRRYIEQHLQKPFESEWSCNHKRFEPEKLQGVLGYFYTKIYSDPIKQEAMTTYGDQNLKLVDERRDGPIGYDLSYAFTHFLDEKEDPMDAPLFRRMQNAALLLHNFELSQGAYLRTGMQLWPNFDKTALNLYYMNQRATPHVTALSLKYLDQPYSSRTSRLEGNRYPEVVREDRDAIKGSPIRETFQSILLKQQYVSHTLRPTCLISFARRAFIEFSSPEIRSYFEHHFFRAPMDRFESFCDAFLNEHFKVEVLKFLHEQRKSLEHNITDANIDTNIFLIRIAIQLLSFMPSSLSEHGEFIAELREYANSYLEQLPLGKLQVENQANICLHRALFQSVLLLRNEYDPLEVLDSWLTHLHNPLTSESMKSEIGYLVFLLEERIIPHLSQLCPSSLEGMQKLSVKLFDKPCDSYQVCDLKVVFKAEPEPAADVELTATICLLRGDLFTYGSQSKTPFPLQLLHENKDFCAIIDPKHESYSSRFGPAYLYIENNKGSYRVSYSDKRTRIFLIEKRLSDGTWALQIRRDDVFRVYQVLINEDNVKSDVPLPIIDACDVWAAPDNRVIFTSCETGREEYVDVKGRQLLTTEGKKVHCSTGMSLVKAIEHPSFSYVETDEDGNAVLTLPRYNSLKFEKKRGDDKWRYSSDPTYSIQLETKRELGYLQQFLVLVSDSGHVVVLLPDLLYTKQEGEMCLDLVRMPEEYNFQDRAKKALPRTALGEVGFNIVPVSQQKLSPASKEQALICAYFVLGMREYESAREFLETVSQADIVNSPTCKRNLNKLIGLISKYIKVPEGSALRTKASYLLARCDQSGLASLDLIYHEYLNQLGNIPIQYRLSQQEELWILTALKKLSEEEVEEGEKFKYRSSFAFRMMLLERQTIDLRSLVLSHKTFVEDFKVSLPKDFNGLTDQQNDINLDPRTLQYDQYLLLMRDFNLNLKALYNCCIDAKKDRRIRHEVESIISAAILLNPRVRENSAFLLGVLRSSNTVRFSPPIKETRYYEYYNTIGWRQSMLVCHSLGAGEIALDFGRLDPSPARVRESRGAQALELRRLTAPSKQPVILTPDSFTVDPSRVGIASFTLFLFEKRAALLKMCTQSVRYKNEKDHFADPTVLEIREPSKWESAERIAREEFLEGYKLTFEKRAQRRVPSMSLVEILQIKEEIETRQDEREQEVSELERSLLLLANHCSQENLYSGDVAYLGGLERPLNITDLLYLFFFAQPGAYKKANPNLSDDDIQTLFHLSAQFFRTSNENRQLNRIGQTLEKLQTIMITELQIDHTRDAFDEQNVGKHPNFTELLYQLLELTSQNSQADLVAQPERVVFEFAMGFMLRVDPDQISSLQFLLGAIEKGENSTIQFRMGGGKTSVFMVYLLALVALKQGNIPILMTPLFQLEAVEGMLRENLKKTFNVELRTLKLHRRDLSIENLQEVELTLNEVQDGMIYLSPKVLILCPSSIQSMELEFYDCLDELQRLDESTEEGKEELKEKIKKIALLKSILVKLKEHGVVLADETHILLNINEELNFPMGDPENVDEAVIDLVIEIGKVLSHPGIRDVLKLSTNEQAKYFNLRTYQEDILPKIAELISKYKGLFLDDEEQREVLLRYITGRIRPDLQRKLSEQSPKIEPLENDDFRFLQYLFALAKSDREDERQAASMIALTKHILNSLLPYLLSKKTANFHFGRTRNKERAGETVPFITADTPSANKFGNEIEELVLGCLTTVIYGVEEAQIAAVFAKFALDTKFMTEELGVAYEDASPVKECREKFGYAPDEFELKREEIVLKIQQSTQLKFLVQKMTFVEFLEKYELRLNSNAMSIVSLFKQFIAMSGTPPVGLFHHSLQNQVQLDKTVNSDVMHSWMSKAEPIIVVDTRDPAVFLDEIILEGKKSPTFTGLLDLGGVFKDMSNDEVAKRTLEGLPENIRAIVYFTSFGKETSDFPCVLLRGEEEPKRLMSLEPQELKEKHELEPGNFFLLLDKRHCVGIDAPALPDAKFATTWEVGITMSDECQGLARLRKLDNGQNAQAFMMQNEVALFPKFEDMQFKQLDLESQYKVLQKQALKMQGHENAQMKLKAFRKMLVNAVVCAMREDIFQIEVIEQNSAELKRRIACYREYIFIQEKDGLFALYGSLEEEISTLETLLNEQRILMMRLMTEAKEGKISSDVLSRIEAEHALILVLAQRSRDEFTTTTPKSVAQQERLEDGHGVEVERVMQEERVVEQVLEVNEEIEQEIASMQGVQYLTESSDWNFDPKLFIDTQRLKFNVINHYSKDMRQVFEESEIKYSRRYQGAFSKELEISTKCMKPYLQNISIFDRRRPYFNYMVIIKEPNSIRYKGVIVSRFEAENLQAYLGAHKEINDVWLVLPNQEFLEGNRESFPYENEAVKFLLMEFNILVGNLNYCFKNLPLYLLWLSQESEEFDEAETLKERFVNLIYHLRRSLYGRHHLLLTEKDKVEQLVYKEDYSDLIEAARSIDPKEIHEWNESHSKQVRFLSLSDQILALPDGLVKFLEAEQMELISPMQARLITNIRCIKRLPERIISRLEITKLPHGMVGKFSRKQLGFVTDPEIFKLIPKEQWKYVHQDAVNKADASVLKKENFSHFSHHQIVHISQEVFIKLRLQTYEWRGRIREMADDQKSLLYMLQHNKDGFLSPDSRDGRNDLMYMITDPTAVSYLEGDEIFRLSTDVIVEAIKVPRYTPKFQAIRNKNHIGTLISNGFKELLPEQVVLIDNLGIIARIPDEFLTHLQPVNAKHIEAPRLTDELIIQFHPQIAIDKVLRFTDIQLKIYVNQISDEQSVLNPLRTVRDQALLSRLLDQGYGKHMTSEQIGFLGNQIDIAKLPDEKLTRLNTRQVGLIKDSALVKRLPERFFMHLPKEVVQHIPVEKITRDSIPYIRSHLIRDQVESFDQSQLRAYLEGMREANDVLIPIEDLTFLQRLEALDYRHFTPEQNAILYPPRTPSPVLPPPPHMPTPEEPRVESPAVPQLRTPTPEEPRVESPADTEEEWEAAPQPRKSTPVESLADTEEESQAASPPRTATPVESPADTEEEWEAAPQPRKSTPVNPHFVRRSDDSPVEERPVIRRPSQRAEMDYCFAYDEQPNIFGFTVDEMANFIKGNKNHKEWLNGVDDIDTISVMLSAGFTDLVDCQVRMIQSEKDLLKLPEAKLSLLTKDQVKGLKGEKLIGKLGPDQASHVKPEYAKYLSKTAVAGIENKEVFRALRYSQLRLAKCEQMKLASVVQSVAYSVITLANAFFSMMIFPIVETLYWTTHVCCFHGFDTAHKYVKGSIGRQLSLSWYVMKQTLFCGMCYSDKKAVKKLQRVVS